MKVPPRTRVGVVVGQLGRGGAERQTVLLLDRLRSTPWEPVGVYCLSDDLEPYGKALMQMGYRVVSFERSGHWDLGRLMRLRSEIAKAQLDLVHAVHLLASAYSFAASLGLRRVRVLPTVRGSMVESGRLRSFVYRWMFRSSRMTLVNSHAGADFLQRRFRVPGARICIVPNGIEFGTSGRKERHGRLRSVIGVESNAPIVGYVGKLSPVKDIPTLLDVWAQVSALREDAHVVLIGNGLDARNSEALMKGVPPQRTHLLGPRDDVRELMLDMDVLVLTSQSEGSPNVVLEALGSGVPVVSTDVGDVGRMVQHGNTGYVVRGGDPAELVAGVVAVLERRSEWRARVMEASVHLRDAYSVDAMVASTVRAWESVSSTPRGRRRLD